MTPNSNRAVAALDAMPDAQELLAAKAAGMTLLAWRAAGRPVNKTAAVNKTRGVKQKPAIRPYAPYRSKWEAAYAQHLEDYRLARIVESWEYEPVKLEIGVGAVYTPDFRVMQFGRTEFHEVKGYRREAAIVRIKAAALRYPEFKFVIVTKLDGGWSHTHVGAKR